MVKAPDRKLQTKSMPMSLALGIAFFILGGIIATTPSHTHVIAMSRSAETPGFFAPGYKAPTASEKRRERNTWLPRYPMADSTLTSENPIPEECRRVPIGSWGGEHILLIVKEKAATFEIDCAHGTVDGPLVLDANGLFSGRGHYIRERGGPDREGQKPDSHEARYSGWSDGKTMTLTITLTDSGQTIGKFHLTLGAEPQITKCE